MINSEQELVSPLWAFFKIINHLETETESMVPLGKLKHKVNPLENKPQFGKWRKRQKQSSLQLAWSHDLFQMIAFNLIGNWKLSNLIYMQPHPAGLTLKLQINDQKLNYKTREKLWSSDHLP